MCRDVIKIAYGDVDVIIQQPDQNVHKRTEKKTKYQFVGKTELRIYWL